MKDQLKKQKGLTRRSTTEGFTLFIAIVITATLLLVSTGIISVAVKEAFLTTANRHSQEAFYAADTGIECVLYWDLKNSGLSAFATSTPANISCNNQSFTVGGATGESRFTLIFPPNKYCAELFVKTTNVQPKTSIESLGYNDCDSSNPRRVQRALKATY